MAVALALGVRWWTHPTLFTSLGDRFVSAPQPVAESALSTTVVFPLTDKGEAERITLRDLHAVFKTNTAEADAAFYVCHMGAGESPIGAGHDPRQDCGDFERFEPGTSFELDVAPSDYLFVSITPARPGVAHLTHVRLDYALGADHFWQRGEQTIEVNRRVIAE